MTPSHAPAIVRRGEALTGAHTGRAIEPRNHYFGVPTLFTEAEGNTTERR